MKDATHYLHPFNYKVVGNKVLIWKKGKWQPSAYEHAAYFHIQQDLVTLANIKHDPVAGVIKKYGLRREQAKRMAADGVLILD